MFQLINRKLHSLRIRLHVSTKIIPFLFPSYYSLQPKNNPAHYKLQSIIFAPDDTHHTQYDSSGRRIIQLRIPLLCNV